MWTLVFLCSAITAQGYVKHFLSTQHHHGKHNHRQNHQQNHQHNHQQNRQHNHQQNRQHNHRQNRQQNHHIQRPSCRQSCGMHLGSCSCTSSCRYYGNCCYDYYSKLLRGATNRTANRTANTPANRTANTPANRTTNTTTDRTANTTTDRTANTTTNRTANTTTNRTANTTTNRTANTTTDRTANTTTNTTTNRTTIYRLLSSGYYGTTNHHSYTRNHHKSGVMSSEMWIQLGKLFLHFFLPVTVQLLRHHIPPLIGHQKPQASCRQRCGYNFGSCSCTSSCRYNGNCCYDYYNYCPVVTTGRPTPTTTTSQASCRQRCGYDFGSCSCRSSCQNYGNCCYDYTSSASSCGGSLSGSGVLTSPNHPNYYQDNMNCVWQLRASHDETVFLSFTYLQLETCCGCDYIQVYDGPSVHSRYLGTVCYNSMNSSVTSFKSSSNYLTVRFRTDSSVVGRGFKADFISSLPPSSGQVNCSADYMSIVIQRSYLNSHGYSGHNMYLDDEHCRPSVTSSQVIFRFPINSCRTLREYKQGSVVYSNAVRAYPTHIGEITRQSFLKLNVACRMAPDATAEIMYIAHHVQNDSIIGTGRFHAQMAFYTSSSFYYQVTQAPYEVTLNQNLYVQVNLRRSDSNLVVFLDTCVASPFHDNFHTRTYDLIRNGCARDSTYYSYSSGTTSYSRFRFRAFQFLRATEKVFLQCKVIMCSRSDYNSRCRQGCHSRVARDLGTGHDSQTLVLGPIQLKEPKKLGGAQKKEVKDKQILNKILG
ncbi:CUB and zona pellucida-like domains 1-1 protein [Genypterus blacodes]|uniref:CUB and zona pellucida-like domains 1-1 protein n=1 Tax=Genypterus blacodes TaxID=154954 RepID=UPI003F7694DC